MRVDSTVNSAVICTVGRGQKLEVLKEFYDWYKVRLPRHAPAFISKKFVAVAGRNAVTVTADNVNIRLGPDTSSPIIGKADRGATIELFGESGEWFQINPGYAAGWIKKQFLKKTPEPVQPEPPVQVQPVLPPPPPPLPPEEVLEGLVRPYHLFFGKIASHNLLTSDGRVFFLKGNPELLNQFNQRHARVYGKIDTAAGKKYPVLEVSKAEAL